MKYLFLLDWRYNNDSSEQAPPYFVKFLDLIYTLDWHNTGISYATGIEG
jgi:hypothetical protein